MIRFFGKIGSVKLQGTIYADPDEGFPASYEGEVEQLIATLRQCPSYQIDRNHAHCGIRARLIPALDPIQALLRTESGICRSCWKEDRARYRWYEGEPPTDEAWYPREEKALPAVSGYPEQGVARCRGTSPPESKPPVAPPAAGPRTGGKKQRNEPCRCSGAAHWQAKELFAKETRDWDHIA
jgi:hypothetical protein